MEGIPRDSSVYESYTINTPIPRLGEPKDIARPCTLPDRARNPPGSPARSSMSTVATACDAAPTSDRLLFPCSSCQSLPTTRLTKNRDRAHLEAQCTT